MGSVHATGSSVRGQFGLGGLGAWRGEEEHTKGTKKKGRQESQITGWCGSSPYVSGVAPWIAHPSCDSWGMLFLWCFVFQTVVCFFFIQRSQEAVRSM